jgi:RNA:NAD 2'-phosphotransferase (TPT1/KptA family)
MLQWTSAGFAFLAAILWLASALVKLPPDRIGYDTVDRIVPALRRQSRWSAAAAICAAVAAEIQAALIAGPTCISLG